MGTSEQKTFGTQLKEYRQICYNRQDGPPFSRKNLAKELSKDIKTSALTKDVIENLENDEAKFWLKNREIILELIKTLVRLHGIISICEANQLLNLSGHSELTRFECENINSGWLEEFDKVAREKTEPFCEINAKIKAPIKDHQETDENGLSANKLIGEAPMVPPIFLGRENNILELRNLLTNKNTENIQVLTAMRGWPGIGKTTTAAALAHDEVLIERFNDGILWASLGQHPMVLSKLFEWGRALGYFEVMAARSPEEAGALITSILKNKRILLIVDDVWSINDLKPFLVGGKKCGTIVTTRKTSLANQITTKNQIYPLPGLSSEKSVELFSAFAPSVYDKYPQECLDLIQSLEGLPLAIRVAGNLLQTEVDSGLPVLKLISDIKNGSILIQSSIPADRKEFIDTTPTSVASLLLSSVNHLSETARDCFLRLRVFAGTPATFTRENAAFVWQEENPDNILKELLAYGLLEFEEPIQRYRIHSILVSLANSLANS